MEAIINNNEEIDALDKILSKKNLEKIHKNEIHKIYNKDFKPLKTPKYMTLFEYTAILGKRASQLQDNVPILISDYDKNDSLMEIAKKELKERVIPFIIERPLPNGLVEHVHIKYLTLRE
jgi:DNA-directed RNA polymerase subunit K/omega